LPVRSQNDLRPPTEAVDDDSVEVDSASDEQIGDGAVAADQFLVNRCIQGDVAAWEELYHQCHAPLCTTIRTRLGRLGADFQLVDEMASTVWYSLVEHDGRRLTKFNCRRGSILSFIRAIARTEISNYFRTERRRLKKELAGALKRNRRESAAHKESLSAVLCAEFLASLTPRERDFCYEYLQVSPDDAKILAETSYSSANIWQLTSRIYKKFRDYFNPIG
jgi:DNA-directed RNA polymerase specialized sigma24 family protein